MNILKKLAAGGQSLWLDNLSRDMIMNGELEKRIQEQEVKGVTSNPAIFQKAVEKSTLYNNQLGKPALENLSAGEIYQNMVIKDVQEACDLFHPVYVESEGIDGYVSLEVSPHLAYDTEGTIDEARTLFKKVDRPNVLIKIPATAEGLPAIETLLFEGVNINITLIFSVSRYEKVARAYIRALENRVLRHLSIDRIASVASFFVSRIDVLVDQLLNHRVLPNGRYYNNINAQLLKGEAAIAMAKFIYQKYRRIFYGKKWNRLLKHGAKLQRVLWASTGTKNPDYSDVKYIEALVGKDTVTTMPEKTLDAFADHGTVKKNAVKKDMKEASKVISDLDKIGIEPAFVTRQLLNDGIQKFIGPFDKLITSIEEKRRQFNAEINTAYHQQL